MSEEFGKASVRKANLPIEIRIGDFRVNNSQTSNQPSTPHTRTPALHPPIVYMHSRSKVVSA